MLGPLKWAVSLVQKTKARYHDRPRQCAILFIIFCAYSGSIMAKFKLKMVGSDASTNFHPHPRCIKRRSGSNSHTAAPIIMEDVKTEGLPVGLGLGLDPEAEFLASKQETGDEWELLKENVRPLKRGRNVTVLNQSLKSYTDSQLKSSLLQTRRKLIEAIDEYQGDDPLSPWIECIKWVQESFPSGGDSSGLIVIYEQCVRTFWHSDRYKNDLRYLKVWLEYAENCSDAEVIYNFLEANEIGKSHAAYYLAYASHMESKSKMKVANDIFNNGISRDAQPIEKLRDAYKKFLIRSMRKRKVVEEDSGEANFPMRSFGTVLSSTGNRRQNVESSDLARKQMKPNTRTPLSVYKDTNVDTMPGNHDKLRADLNPWSTLGARAERNKENNPVPTKWTTYKIPQKPGARAPGAASSATIEVFVDEECTGINRPQGHSGKASSLQLRHGDGLDVKKETELLRENPLRNFPLSSLPR